MDRPINKYKEQNLRILENSEISNSDLENQEKYLINLNEVSQGPSQRESLDTQEQLSREVRHLKIQEEDIGLLTHQNVLKDYRRYSADMDRSSTSGVQNDYSTVSKLDDSTFMRLHPVTRNDTGTKRRSSLHEFQDPNNSTPAFSAKSNAKNQMKNMRNGK